MPATVIATHPAVPVQKKLVIALSCRIRIGPCSAGLYLPDTVRSDQRDVDAIG